jgi:DNA invertase Pin-like site-specific DNA recombinase
MRKMLLAISTPSLTNNPSARLVLVGFSGYLDGVPGRRAMRAIGYVRVSTDGQADSGLGLEAQRSTIANAAKRAGANLASIHEDAGLSGALALEDRPGLLAAVDALRRGDALLVAKRDRLGRDPIAVAMIERLVARKGARVLSALEEGTNGDDPTNVLMRRMLDAFAEFERLLIGARTRAALRAKRARGERAGNVPFGYRAAPDGKLEAEPREQKIIASVRELRGLGFKLREIVKWLRAEGVVGRTGRPLGLAQVHAIVKAA